MTVHLVCRCGAELTIEDGSEDRVAGLVTLWLTAHRCTGRAISETPGDEWVMAPGTR